MPTRKGELPLRDHLRRLAAWQVVGPVLVEHNNEATYILAADGSRWVAKSVEVTGPQQFVAEAISYQLAAALHVPVPEGAWGRQGNEVWWFSRCVSPVMHFHPMRLPLTQSQSDFGRVLALDVWMINEDRHAGNILLESGEGLFRPWFIDFGSAVVGHVADFERRLEAVPREAQFVARAVAGELLREGALQVCDTVSSLHEADLRSVVLEACLLAGLGADGDRLADAVLKRRSGLTPLVRAFLARLGISP